MNCRMLLLFVLLIVGLLLEAVSALPSANGDTTAYFGGDAHFSCRWQDRAGVRQVTWQKLHKDRPVENVASYNKRDRIWINDLYHGKVAFTEASLGSTSITVKNLTWTDDACYTCSFSVYPSGSETRETCLSVQGISKVETRVTQIPGSGAGGSLPVAVSCSATGRPAPHIEWNTGAGWVSDGPSNTTTTANADHTFTSLSSLSLRPGPGAAGPVECVLNGGTARERREAISVPTSSEQDSNTGTEDRGGEAQKGWIAIIPVVIVITCISCMVFKRRKIKEGLDRLTVDSRMTKDASVV